MGEKRGRVTSRKIHEGPMDKDNRMWGGEGGLNVGGEMGRAGESYGGKMETTVIEQQ